MQQNPTRPSVEPLERGGKDGEAGVRCNIATLQQQNNNQCNITSQFRSKNTATDATNVRKARAVLQTLRGPPLRDTPRHTNRSDPLYRRRERYV